MTSEKIDKKIYFLYQDSWCQPGLNARFEDARNEAAEHGFTVERKHVLTPGGKEMVKAAAANGIVGLPLFATINGKSSHSVMKIVTALAAEQDNHQRPEEVEKAETAEDTEKVEKAEEDVDGDDVKDAEKA